MCLPCVLLVGRREGKCAPKLEFGAAVVGSWLAWALRMHALGRRADAAAEEAASVKASNINMKCVQVGASGVCKGAVHHTLVSVALCATSFAYFSKLAVHALHFEGSCMPDFSKPCPLGWREDVNHDCLAPVGYSGQCVGRKSFQSLRQSEKELWAKSCDVTWYLSTPALFLQLLALIWRQC